MRKIIVVLVSTLNFIIVNDKVERIRRHTKHDLFLSEIQHLKCSRWRRRYDNDDDDADDDDDSESRLRIAPGSTGEGSPT